VRRPLSGPVGRSPHRLAASWPPAAISARPRYALGAVSVNPPPTERRRAVR